VFMLVGSLVLVAVFLARIPHDYFAQEDPPPGQFEGRHALLYWSVTIARNVVGFVLIVAGIAMLVLPGQGLLTILIGLILAQFPGKRALELRLVSRPEILRGLNWFRGVMRRRPFEVMEST
jgi:hypothetical protein